jgi:hypothetical protein
MGWGWGLKYPLPNFEIFVKGYPHPTKKGILEKKITF